MNIVWICLLAAPAPATIAVDLTQLDAPAFQALEGLDLEQRILVRLVQDGFAVVDASGAPELVLRLRAKRDQLVLEGEGPAGRRTRSLRWNRRQRTAELHLEIVQLAVELVDKLANVEPVAQPAAPPPPPIVNPPPAAPEESDWRVELYAGGGARLTNAGYDPQLTLGVATNPRADIVAWAELHGGYAPGSDDARVWNGNATLAFGWRVLKGERMRLEVYGALGVEMQRYVVTLPAASEPRGFSWSSRWSVPVRLRWQLAGRWLVGADLAPTFHRPTYRHTYLGETVWQRAPWSVETTVFVGRGID